MIKLEPGTRLVDAIGVDCVVGRKYILHVIPQGQTDVKTVKVAYYTGVRWEGADIEYAQINGEFRGINCTAWKMANRSFKNLFSRYIVNAEVKILPNGNYMVDVIDALVRDANILNSYLELNEDEDV